jgi:hypothetical protein
MVSHSEDIGGETRGEGPAQAGGEQDEDALRSLFGFSGFDSTKVACKILSIIKGKHVPGADASGANIKKKRVYRQYMNKRRGTKSLIQAAGN